MNLSKYSRYLSVIIPAYNEMENFEKGVLDKVWEYLKKQPYSWEVLLVDDGSNDGSVSQFQKFCKSKEGFRLIENAHMGKAGTVAKGVKEAKGEYMLFTDFDQATPIRELEKLLPHIEEGHDIAIGSREVAGAKREKEPFYRHLMGKVFNFLVRFMAVWNYADTQCGFKLFRANAARDLFDRLRVYKPKPIKPAFTGAFDVELLFLAKKYGYSVAEVPIHWRHVKTSRVSPAKDSVMMAYHVFKIRLFDLLGFYE